MRTIPREPSLGLELGRRRDYTRAPWNELEAYLVGASHDGTWNTTHRTFRFTQRERAWLVQLQQMLKLLKYRSWIYQEGRHRSVWALETTFCPSTHTWHLTKRLPGEWMAYIRGFFDAEGGIPRQATARFYIQFVQKNQPKLIAITQALGAMGIATGTIHNPSQRIDPSYWRFFVATRSHELFAQTIGSWHPRKSKIFETRMKI